MDLRGARSLSPSKSFGYTREKKLKIKNINGEK